MHSAIDTQVYPFVDEHGYTWYNPSTFIGPQSGTSIHGLRFRSPCFICGKLVLFIDIDYQGYFCGSYACNLTIDRDLRGLSKYVNAAATEDLESGEVHR